MSEVIFLVGMGRSGTTWVGQMLAANLSFTYIHEPFNWLSFGAGEYRFKYLDPETTDSVFDAQWKKCVRGKGNVLIKDIHTPFTLPYVKKYFNPDRIFVIRRNPLATFDSWLRMGWTINLQFEAIRSQPELVKLLPDKVLPAGLRTRPYSYRFGVLWSCYYRIVEQLGVGEIIDYEELASHNIKESMRFLGYEATRRGEKFFQKHARVVGQRHPYTTYRDPEVCVAGWKRNVTAYHIEQIGEALDQFGHKIGDFWS